MKLLFKQRIFSWFDSYDIFDEEGNTVFVVQGKMAWGHKLVIYDAAGEELATVKQVVLTLMPKFELYIKDKLVGTLRREFAFFKPIYNIDYNGWRVEGNWMEWDYQIKDGQGNRVADVSKELFHLSDHYTIDTEKREDALGALMVVLAIDAEKCSRNN